LDTRFLRANDLNFHLAEWGETSQPKLVLLHGLASTLHMFDLIAPALAQHFHVIAFDQRGHGLTDKPTGGYDFETIASDLDAVLEQLAIEQASLAGHSWGAYTALYYTASRHERIRKCILIDGGVIPISHWHSTWAQAEVGMAPPLYQQRSLDDIQTMIQQDWLGRIYRPELAPLALSIFDTTHQDNVKPHLNRSNHMQIAHALWEFQPAHYFDRVTVPTRIINAVAADSAGQAVQQLFTQEALRQLANGRAIWMEDTSHDIPWHRPNELVAVMLDFLVD
jgi:pimeloyl-ACP methyl ester carboxylesterase